VLLLKNLLFTVLVPGTVAGVLPYLIVTRHGTGLPARMGLVQVLGAALALCGAAIYARCVWDFAKQGRGTPAPVDPPKRLVVRGLYRYVRNPMYGGVLLVLLGETFFFVSLPLLLYSAIWFALVNLFVLLYEEPTLRRRFPEGFASYSGAVRRWIPGEPYPED
jgi:protein-S-isoprenylcysteine O-methyltransferase Ste14